METIDFSAEDTAPVVACGCYSCSCVMLAAQYDEVPKRCPTHDKGLLGSVSWERNPHNVPLGLSAVEVTPA